MEDYYSVSEAEGPAALLGARCARSQAWPRGAMPVVTVVFTNGNIVEFTAQEFDADLGENRRSVNKYPYKDASGQDSAIHLTPDEVAGVFLTPAADH